MFGLTLCKRLRFSIAQNGLSFSKPSSVLHFLTSSFSSENDQTCKAHSFTVSYLVDSRGLSPESATVASKKVRLETRENPDSLLALLRANEFSEAQISRLVVKYPKCLVRDPAKVVLPKLEFFYSQGVSKKDMAMILSSYPKILSRSLSKFIRPNFELLKSVLKSDLKVFIVLRHPWLCFKKHWENVLSNIRTLRELGVSESSIASGLFSHTRVLILDPDRVRGLACEATSVGFLPEKSTFLPALTIFASERSRMRYRENSEVFKRWGWSEDDILDAFRYHPGCMILSEDKIGKMMDFMVDVMGQPARKLAGCPVVLCYSFEKRVVPRFSVIRVLLSKGLISDSSLKISSILTSLEKKFVAKYMTGYEKDVPQLMSVYRGEVKVEDL